MVEDLRGGVALVTGASRRREIGTAICRALAGEGADVFFTHWVPFDRTQPEGEDPETPTALQEELRGMGVRAEGMEMDLSLPDSPGGYSTRSLRGSAHLPSSSTTLRTPRATASRTWMLKRSTRTMR